MAMPAAQGLFHRAWTMSGQQVTAAGPRAAAQRARMYMDALGAGDVAALLQRRAFHTLDIPLVFDNLAQPGSRTGTSAEARLVANAMRDALLAFARSGDPRTGATSAWAPYTLPRRETTVFGATPAMQDDPRGGERRLYARAPFVQGGTY
jgi:para-nitrobenzyl esterase